MTYMSEIKYDAIRKVPNNPRRYVEDRAKALDSEGKHKLASKFWNCFYNWDMVPPWATGG